MVFQPGYTDIMSAANNDALVNALSAMLFLALAWLFNRPPSRRRGLVGGAAVVALLAAALLVKTSALALLIALPLAVFFYLVRGSKRPWLWVVVAGAFLVALAGIIALVLQTAMSPQGRGLADFISRYFRINFAGTVNSLLSGGRVSYATLVEVVFKSFWAIFGWRHIYLAPWAYWLPLLGMTGAAIGLGVSAWRGARRPRQPAPPGLAFLALAAVVVAITATIAVLRGQVDQGAVYHSHGRYAYVAMVPFALLFAAGWLGWLPQAWRRRGLVVFIAAVALFNAIAFWGFLVPYYYF